MNAPVFFENAGDERGTPQAFFDQLNAEFHFDIDAAATPRNHKCELWYGEGGIENDALEADWAGMSVYLNPPYSAAGAFVAKAREEADKGATVVLLIPARTDTRYWHRYIWDKNAVRHTGSVSTDPMKFGPLQIHKGDWYPGVEVRFVAGRLQFELDVPNDLRAWIKAQQASYFQDQGTISDNDWLAFLRAMVIATGLPKMSIERILQDYPDDDLLEGAPFPSCVVIFRKVRG